MLSTERWSGPHQEDYKDQHAWEEAYEAWEVTLSQAKAEELRHIPLSAMDTTVSGIHGPRRHRCPIVDYGLEELMSAARESFQLRYGASVTSHDLRTIDAFIREVFEMNVYLPLY